jgi:hypothetical protein
LRKGELKMTKLETQLYTALRALLDADIEIGEDEGDDSVFDVAHDAQTAYERAEIAATEYRAKNPLGGPAKMFEAAASRIRAGETARICAGGLRAAIRAT